MEFNAEKTHSLQRYNNNKKPVTKAKLLQLKLIHIFAREILLLKKLEIEVHFYNISFKS